MRNGRESRIESRERRPRKARRRRERRGMAREFTLGVIGVGNMGAALVRGVVRAGALSAERIVVADPAPGKAEELAAELGVRTAQANAALAGSSDYVALVVKPGMVPAVLRKIEPAVIGEQTVISFAAGVPLRALSQGLAKSKPGVIRVMPNTPALVGAGMFALAGEAAPEKVEYVRGVLSQIGRVLVVEDSLMDAVTGLSGSGPAFVFVLIEALADGGVAAGLPRAMAQELAAQTVFGAAKMVLESGQHPGQLKDMVASPGGTTIAGLAVLEESNFRGALVRAVRAAAQRSRELSEAK